MEMEILDIKSGQGRYALFHLNLQLERSCVL